MAKNVFRRWTDDGVRTKGMYCTTVVYWLCPLQYITWLSVVGGHFFRTLSRERMTSAD